MSILEKSFKIPRWQKWQGISEVRKIMLTKSSRRVTSSKRGPMDIAIRMAKASMEKIFHLKPTMVKIKSLMTNKIKKRKSLSILPPRDHISLMMLLVLFIQVI
jgi:hypothetical protein